MCKQECQFFIKPLHVLFICLIFRNKVQSSLRQIITIYRTIYCFSGIIRNSHCIDSAIFCRRKLWASTCPIPDYRCYIIRELVTRDTVQDNIRYHDLSVQIFSSCLRFHDSKEILIVFI